METASTRKSILGIGNPMGVFADRKGKGNRPDEETPLIPEVRRRKRPRWLYGKREEDVSKPPGAFLSIPDEKKRRKKLGTFTGVFVPTTLNVFSILMFLRFGFILGQAGVIGMLGMLIASYLVDFLTALSISAVSSNGTVRGGGAYYLISRSLGPEFGGSIGLVFFIGQVLNTGMNAVGLVNCLMSNFAVGTGSSLHIFPEGFWWRYIYAAVVTLVCTITCFFGSSIFSKASTFLLLLLLVATFSIPVSALFIRPFTIPELGVTYTGLSAKTLRNNLWPKFTSGAAGSERSGVETWSSLFGILFPATGGIFAGASMSGDLKNPSKSIPQGTLRGLGFTFVSYTMVILSLGASVTRTTFYKDLDVIQDINFSPTLILIGEISTSLFSTLMGIVGSSKCLQAIAKDDIFPGLKVFSRGTKATDEPILAIILTLGLTLVTLLADINQIASFVTMTYLMTFFGTNLACFLLKLGSAPNFRPSFNYFSWHTAAAGVLLSGLTMFFVDGAYASACVLILIVMFIVIHYSSPPKTWGDVSQSLIYHQVRKYLLRLKTEHVKFWRPQVLLLVNDPRRSWKLIQFCNSIKKGGLYILGHIIVAPDFEESYTELKRQQSAWMKYIDFSRIKGFVHVSVAPTVEWGARNAVLSAGLGGMRPNIVVLGFYNLDEYRSQGQAIYDISEISDIKSPTQDEGSQQGELPTDGCRPEKAVGVTNYVNILEDLLLSLRMNVAVAKGFRSLELPSDCEGNRKKYIDLWPIQMAAEYADSDTNTNLLTTNFDTYTLILQLGCILTTVDSWKKRYRLRVCVFVEYESDVEEEHTRVKRLLENLRISAEVCVTWLASGKLQTYEAVVCGKDVRRADIDKVLGKDEWWRYIKRSRARASHSQSRTDMRDMRETWPHSSFHQGVDNGESSVVPGFGRFFGKTPRHSFGGATKLARAAAALTLSMRTHRLHAGAIESSESDTEDSFLSDYTSDEDSIHSAKSAGEGERRDGALLPWSDGTQAGPASRRASTSSVFSEVSTSTIRPVKHRTNTEAKNDKGYMDPSRGEAGKRPKLEHRTSTPAFTSRAIPNTAVAEEETAGPSIGFVKENSKGTGNESELNSTYRTIPQLYGTGQLSFNDLPSKAQHLILNELIRQNSQDTAVVFTTLPSPSKGTYRSEKESLEYLVGLEIFTDRLPPTLMVHSNSLTVTTSL